ncbi:MAG: hypothetical protein V9E88_10850 [Ferruginibacter sp.]
MGKVKSEKSKVKKVFTQRSKVAKGAKAVTIFKSQKSKVESKKFEALPATSNQQVLLSFHAKRQGSKGAKANYRNCYFCMLQFKFPLNYKFRYPVTSN